VPPLPSLRLAALLHDVGKPATFFLGEDGEGHFYNHDKTGIPLAAQALERLRADRATREQALLLIEKHHLPVEVSERWAGRWLSRLGEESFFRLLHLKRGDALACSTSPADLTHLDEAETLARSLLSRQPCLSLKALAVDGTDCMAIGLEGRQIGNALRRLLEQVSEGALPNDRTVLLNELKKSSSP